MTFLKLQFHLWTSIAPHDTNKLIFRFYGTFKVLQKVGRVAYKLDLPSNAKIHMVVHVSQLKKQVPVLRKVTQDLSLVCTDPTLALLPTTVLKHALVSRASATAAHLRLQWGDLPVHMDMATWEDEADLR